MVGLQHAHGASNALLPPRLECHPGHSFVAAAATGVVIHATTVAVGDTTTGSSSSSTSASTSASTSTSTAPTTDAISTKQQSVARNRQLRTGCEANEVGKAVARHAPDGTYDAVQRATQTTAAQVRQAVPDVDHEQRV